MSCNRNPEDSDEEIQQMLDVEAPKPMLVPMDFWSSQPIPTCTPQKRAVEVYYTDTFDYDMETASLELELKLMRERNRTREEAAVMMQEWKNHPNNKQ